MVSACHVLGSTRSPCLPVAQGVGNSGLASPILLYANLSCDSCDPMDWYTYKQILVAMLVLAWINVEDMSQHSNVAAIKRPTGVQTSTQLYKAFSLDVDIILTNQV